MTHNKIVEVAAKWLRKHDQNIIIPNCKIIATELNTANCTGEIPDVIGFSSNKSILIEVKTSIADFIADQKKKFREYPEIGMGANRYFLCPTDLIKPEQLPKKWGLLYIDKNGIITIIQKAKDCFFNVHAEKQMLYSILIRR